MNEKSVKVVFFQHSSFKSTPTQANSGKIKRFLFLSSLLLLCLSILSLNKNVEEKRDYIKKSEFIPKFTIKPMPYENMISIGDRCLSEWSEKYLVFFNTGKLQWKSIRGRTPEKTAENDNDIEIKVYMAHDTSFWYIGAQVKDDAIISSQDNMFSGDCLEIFFAGLELNSPLAIQYHVSQKKHTFFQLEIPSYQSKNKVAHFSKYRTDNDFLDSIRINNSRISIWKTDVGFNAEIRISIASFSVKLLDQNNLFKMSIDYLDYDKIAASKLNNNGFWPDNVFCSDSDECNVNVPMYMPFVVFPSVVQGNKNRTHIKGE